MGRGDPRRYSHQNIFWTTKLSLQVLSMKCYFVGNLLVNRLFVLYWSSFSFISLNEVQFTYFATFYVLTLSRHAPLRRAEDCKFRAISKARLWHHCLYTCLLSTSSSLTTLIRKSHLVAGFALRCFQRLSDPDMDTRRCAWRHNR